jgi:hypothetical protein
MSFFCKKCGESVESEHIIRIKEIEHWELALGDTELAQKLTNKFSSERGPGYRTLYLSATFRVSILASHLDRLTLAQEAFKTKLVPALQIVDANFKVLGSLACPSTVDLAVTDLSQPVCVFAFVTVEDAPNLQEKLEALGLKNVTTEGLIGTLDGQTWSDLVSKP